MQRCLCPIEGAMFTWMMFINESIFHLSIYKHTNLTLQRSKQSFSPSHIKTVWDVLSSHSCWFLRETHKSQRFCFWSQIINIETNSILNWCSALQCNVWDGLTATPDTSSLLVLQEFERRTAPVTTILSNPGGLFFSVNTQLLSVPSIHLQTERAHYKPMQKPHLLQYHDQYTYTVITDHKLI